MELIFRRGNRCNDEIFVDERTTKKQFSEDNLI